MHRRIRSSLRKHERCNKSLVVRLRVRVPDCGKFHAREYLSTEVPPPPGIPAYEIPQYHLGVYYILDFILRMKMQ
jgi:hypothetical protein